MIKSEGWKEDKPKKSEILVPMTKKKINKKRQNLPTFHATKT
jgi:hypothetical protein